MHFMFRSDEIVVFTLQTKGIYNHGDVISRIRNSPAPPYFLNSLNSLFTNKVVFTLQTKGIHNYSLTHKPSLPVVFTLQTKGIHNQSTKMGKSLIVVFTLQTKGIHNQ